jgi:hypothetical protein
MQNPEDREFCRRCGAELSNRDFDENESTKSDEYEEEYDEDEYEEDED